MNIIKYKGLDHNPTHLHETVTVKPMRSNSTILTESTGGETFLMPRIEAIHAGVTRNFNHYLAEKLKGDPVKKTGVHSWIHPYAKPVIYNHDTETEVTGRIVQAAYADYTQAGRPGIVLIPKISEPRAVEALKAGRLLTVSIGATTDAAICSVCGTDIINEGFCGHMKGEEYNGQTCEWISGDIWFDELSWVNVPADQDAMVVDTQSSIFLDKPQEKTTPRGKTTKESSATRSLSELFGIPYGIPLTVVKLQEEATNQNAEKQEQEESEGMDKQTETAIEETDVIETVATEIAEEETTPKTDTPDAPAEPEVETDIIVDTPEDAAEEDEDDAAEEPKEDEVIAKEDDTSVEESLKDLEILSLRAQVEALTSEIKDILVLQISEKAQPKAEVKDAFEARLYERTLDSLRDKLTDLIEESALLGSKEDVQEKETKVEKTRTVTKVASPVPGMTESQKESAPLTEEETINLYKKLLGS